MMDLALLDNKSLSIYIYKEESLFVGLFVGLFVCSLYVFAASMKSDPNFFRHPPTTPEQVDVYFSSRNSTSSGRSRPTPLKSPYPYRGMRVKKYDFFDIAIFS